MFLLYDRQPDELRPFSISPRYPAEVSRGYIYFFRGELSRQDFLSGIVYGIRVK
jgi:hypothetical protein